MKMIGGYMTNSEQAAAMMAGLQACVVAGPRALGPMQDLERVASNVPVELLPAIDAILRQSFSSYQYTGWPELTRNQFAAFQRVPSAWAAMAVAAAHFDGHAREAAVNALAALGDGRAAPFLFVRLNDWVKQVRVAARAALETFLKPEFGGDLLVMLPLVLTAHRRREIEVGAATRAPRRLR